MEYEWDEAKCLANLRKHGIDFIDTPTVFGDNIVTVEGDRSDDGGQRFITFFITFGLSQGRVIAIVLIDREDYICLFLREKRRNMNNELTLSNSQTDWQPLDAMGDKNID